MRWIPAAFVLVFAACHQAVWAMSEEQETTEPFDQAEHAVRMVSVTRQLLDSGHPQQQAAGLLLAELSNSWAWWDQEPILDETESVALLHDLIRRADSASNRALLAQVCAVLDLRADCRRQGLDQAIAEQDGAELIARLDLTDNDEAERARELIIASRALNERYADFALILLDAMETHGDMEPTELMSAWFYSMNQVSPMSLMADQCRKPAIDDPALDRACERMLQALMEGSRSMLFNMLGSRLMAKRAEARGEAAAVDRHEQWRARYRDWMSCASGNGANFWETADAQLLRTFLERFQYHGEASAHAFVAARAGVDCGLPEPSPFSTAAR